jgi:anti-anti-sigma factor
MELVEFRQGAVTVLKPTGPLLEADANEFLARGKDVLAKSLGRFVLDAGGIAYADSRGLEAILELSEAVSESGQMMKVCGETETLREVLDLTEIAPLMEHYDDVVTAVRSFL